MVKTVILNQQLSTKKTECDKFNKGSVYSRGIVLNFISFTVVHIPTVPAYLAPFILYCNSFFSAMCLVLQARCWQQRAPKSSQSHWSTEALLNSSWQRWFTAAAFLCLFPLLLSCCVIKCFIHTLRFNTQLQFVTMIICPQVKKITPLKLYCWCEKLMKKYKSHLQIASYDSSHCSLCCVVSLTVLSHCFGTTLIDFQCTGCTNDVITLVLGSPCRCDGQTLISDMTSSLHVILYKQIYCPHH